jgi:hypothetical protein
MDLFHGSSVTILTCPTPYGAVDVGAGHVCVSRPIYRQAQGKIHHRIATALSGCDLDFPGEFGISCAAAGICLGLFMLDS